MYTPTHGANCRKNSSTTATAGTNWSTFGLKKMDDIPVYSPGGGGGGGGNDGPGAGAVRPGAEGGGAGGVGSLEAEMAGPGGGGVDEGGAGGDVGRVGTVNVPLHSGHFISWPAYCSGTVSIF